MGSNPTSGFKTGRSVLWLVTPSCTGSRRAAASRSFARSIARWSMRGRAGGGVIRRQVRERWRPPLGSAASPETGALAPSVRVRPAERCHRELVGDDALGENKLPELAHVRRGTMGGGDEGALVHISDGEFDRGDRLSRPTLRVYEAKAKPDDEFVAVVDLFAALTRGADIQTSVVIAPPVPDERVEWCLGAGGGARAPATASEQEARENAREERADHRACPLRQIRAGRPATECTSASQENEPIGQLLGHEDLEHAETVRARDKDEVNRARRDEQSNDVLLSVARCSPISAQEPLTRTMARNDPGEPLDDRANNPNESGENRACHEARKPEDQHPSAQRGSPIGIASARMGRRPDTEEGNGHDRTDQSEPCKEAPEAHAPRLSPAPPMRP